MINFSSYKTEIIVATHAFGESVSFEKVGLIIFLDTPPTMTRYIQKSGRAAIGWKGNLGNQLCSIPLKKTLSSYENIYLGAKSSMSPENWPRVQKELAKMRVFAVATGCRLQVLAHLYNNRSVDKCDNQLCDYCENSKTSNSNVDNISSCQLPVKTSRKV